MTADIRDLTGGGHFVRDKRMHKRASGWSRIGESASERIGVSEVDVNGCSQNEQMCDKKVGSSA
jgi:hypothetical protein